MCDYSLSKALDKIENILERNIPKTEENKKDMNELKTIIIQFREEMYRHMSDHA